MKISVFFDQATLNHPLGFFKTNNTYISWRNSILCMSEFVATLAAVLIAVFAVATLFLVIAGNYFFAGTVLTFLAFAIYLREVSN